MSMLFNRLLGSLCYNSGWHTRWYFEKGNCLGVGFFYIL